VPDESKAADELDTSLEAAGDAEALRQKISERVRFLFRKAGENRPARELEQMILMYRLEDRQS